jgi:hypothetical protein
MLLHITVQVDHARPLNDMRDDCIAENRLRRIPAADVQVPQPLCNPREVYKAGSAEFN